MIADEFPEPVAPAQRRWPLLLLFALAAFLAGMLVMVWALANPRILALFADEPVPVTSPATMPVTEIAPSIAPSADPLGANQTEALDQRVALLETRIDQVGRRAQSAAGDAARAEGLLVAFAARRALDRGLGLGYLEGQLHARFGASQPGAVATVIAASRAPVTLEDLRLGLEELAPRLAGAGEGEGWWDGLRRGLSDLVVIRRAGTPSSMSSERLRRARLMVEGGRIDAAMAEVARMPGRHHAEAWLGAARRYVAARRALDVIETTALVADRPPSASAEPPAPATVPAPVGEQPS